MKVKSSLKPRCKDCRLIKRAGVLRVDCIKSRHKQRQG